MTLLERGSGFDKPKRSVDWIKAGPLVVEFWRWWLRLGVCVGCWYVGAYLGPFVVTVGRRQWATLEPSPMLLPAWTLTSATINLELTDGDA